jgi:HK97 family phage portal protein
MSVWSRIRNLFVRENPLQSVWPGAAWWKFVPPNLQLSIPERASLGIVWACIRAITDPIASAPWDVYTRTAKGKRLALPDDPMSWLLSVRPNPEMTAQGFWEFILYAMGTFGNGYARIQLDNASRVVALWPLLTERVRWIRESPDAEITYIYNQANGEQLYMPPDKVLHFRGPMSTSTIFGDANIDRAAKSIARGVAIEQFASAFFANGGIISGWLEIPGNLSPEEKQVLKKDWDSKYGGPKNAHRTAVLEAGAKYHQSEVDAEKTQMMQAHQMTKEDIAQAFGVPLGMINLGPSAQGYWNNYANVTLDFVRRVIRPWHERLAQEVRYKLFPQRAPWRWAEPDLTSLTRGNELQRAQAAEIWIRSGAKTINEVRDQEGEEEVQDGDEILVPSALAPLSRVLEPPEPAAPALPPGKEGNAIEPKVDPGGKGETPKGENPPTKKNVSTALSQLLVRHHARVKARTEDLKKAQKGEADIQRAVEGLRERVSTEMRVILDIIQAVARPEELYSAASAVEAGVAPDVAAQHLIEGVAP